METRLKELLEKELLTEDEINEVEEHDEVLECIYNVYYDNKNAPSTSWFSVKTIDNGEFDIYCKY